MGLNNVYALKEKVINMPSHNFKIFKMYEFLVPFSVKDMAVRVLYIVPNDKLLRLVYFTQRL